MSENPIVALITGAAGQIAYSLIHSIARGDVFGSDKNVQLHLLDLPAMEGILEGVVMEIKDCAFPLVSKVVATSDEKVAFTDVDAAFLVGAMPRREGMERKDLLAANVKIFKSQGKALSMYSKKNVKVLVVGNPANTNAYICMKYATGISKENFSAMTRLDQNRAAADIALRLGINVKDVFNVTIWGNHSSTQYPDVYNAIAMINGTETNPYETLSDEAYLNGEFISYVQKRGAQVIAARKLSSAMSAAKAAADHMHDWFQGTPKGRFISMGVLSDGSYGIPADIIYSFPVTVDREKNWDIVPDLYISDFAREKMNISAQELLEEKAAALEVCKD